jgi:4-oxalomesaconate tautomerase
VNGIRCMLMRGATSKGAYFLAEDLPSDPIERNDLLLRIMGSPDIRQIDGLGGGHPLTSKVGVISVSASPEADVDYLFLQVTTDRPLVTDAQTCGNILAGVGPFAIERGLVAIGGDETAVRIRMVNPTPALVVARVQTPQGAVQYDGDTAMSGVPFNAAPILLSFLGADASVFPTGSVIDTFDSVQVTCVDAGMPVVLLRADDLGLDGSEPPSELEANDRLRARIESIRLQAGAAMGLGDVSETTVPKMSILSGARHGGLVTTRTFIPHRAHEAIGVLGALSVVAGVLTVGTVMTLGDTRSGSFLIEHPTGALELDLELAGAGVETSLRYSTLIRTARKIMDGLVWPRQGD